MGIAAGAPEGGAVNEVEVTVDQFGECVLGPVFGIAAEQRGVIVHWVYLLNNTGLENRTMNRTGGPATLHRLGVTNLGNCVGFKP